MSTILIIEDEKQICDLLHEYFLSFSGLETVFAEDGEKAIQLLDSIQPDIILLDVMLPRINGTALIRFLRNEEKTKTTPVIVMSGQFIDEEFQKDVMTMGADDYIVKPIVLKLLHRKIEVLTGLQFK